MQGPATRIAWYPTAHPGDTAGLERRLASLEPARVRRLVLLAKTEGTATANDFGRDLALVTMHRAVEHAGGTALLARTTVICSMGCEGFTAPGVTLLAAMDDDAAAGPRVGGAASAPLAAGEIGEAGHVEAARATVAAAMADAGLAPAAVRLVFVKSPVLTADAAVELPADRRRWRGDTGRARGVAALGAGLALGELGDGAVAAALAGDPTPHARRCMAFSGTETRRLEAVVLGESVPEAPLGRGETAACAPLTVLTAPLAHPLDRAAIVEALAGAGLGVGADGVVAAPERVVASFLKAGIAPDGRIAGERTTVLSSEVAPDKQLRAAASGFVAGILGHARSFISGGAEHQAPPGGGLFAAIVRGAP